MTPENNTPDLPIGPDEWKTRRYYESFLGCGKFVGMEVCGLGVSCQRCTVIEELLAALDELDRLRTALDKINDIRNSIVGLQSINWSEHIYPLVAALNDAGIQGLHYPEAREYFGTMLERTNAAESRLSLTEQVVDAARAVVETRRVAHDPTKQRALDAPATTLEALDTQPSDGEKR